ncbi:MAG TPA: PHP-associated domain-containing protein [Vicinamibacterales bacterium]|jgi:predicted metal-dependent phosphoesterase TrpH
MSETRARADLHVHTRHSRVSGTLRALRSRDCYSDPFAAYAAAKARGMQIVTFTDHDSIDGCLEFLSRYPDATDFLVGEEVSCRMADTGLQVHLGVYGTSESAHAELQRLRGDVFEAMAFLRASGTFFALNHPFFFFRHQVPLDDYLRLLAMAPAVEVRNGTMLRGHNTLVAELWSRLGGAAPAVTAGSDAHTLRRIGRTWTEAPGTTAAEFLASLRAGAGRAGGDHGWSGTVAADAYGVVARYAASIFGYGPRDHYGWHRLMCAACVVASPPAQFLPAVIAVRGKVEERRVVAAIAATLGREQTGLPSERPGPRPVSPAPRPQS